MHFRPLVLCYHAISDGWPHALATPPGTFERHLRLLLRAGRRPVSSGDLLANRRGTFHVTFDDAYRNVFDAVPILERLGVAATMFACPKYARSGGRFLVPELSGEDRSDPDRLQTMSWGGLADLAARGVEIGSHTVSHPHLPQLTDAEIRRELLDSKAEIEDELGRPCRFLAYPYGDSDGRVHRAAADAGYAAAFALRANPWRAEQFALPRVDVYRRDGTPRFAVKAAPGGGASLAALRAARGLIARRAPSR